MDAIANLLRRVLVDVIEQGHTPTAADLVCRGIPERFAADIVRDSSTITSAAQAAARADQWAITIAHAIDAALAA